MNMSMKKTTKPCPCEKYEERVAIMQYHGGASVEDAKRLARRDICVGCDRMLGIDLFDLVGLNQKKELTWSGDGIN
jgi:hypothetical protein